MSRSACNIFRGWQRQSPAIENKITDDNDLSAVLNVICKCYDISNIDLRECNSIRVRRARAAYWIIAHEYTNASGAEISKAINKSDSAFHHGIKAARKLMENYAEFASEIIAARLEAIRRGLSRKRE